MFPHELCFYLYCVILAELLDLISCLLKQAPQASALVSRITFMHMFVCLKMYMCVSVSVCPPLRP